jgi:hypothetical protein
MVRYMIKRFINAFIIVKEWVKIIYFISSLNLNINGNMRNVLDVNNGPTL